MTMRQSEASEFCEKWLQKYQVLDWVHEDLFVLVVKCSLHCPFLKSTEKHSPNDNLMHRLINQWKGLRVSLWHTKASAVCSSLSLSPLSSLCVLCLLYCNNGTTLPSCYTHRVIGSFLCRLLIPKLLFVWLEVASLVSTEREREKAAVLLFRPLFLEAKAR